MVLLGQASAPAPGAEPAVIPFYRAPAPVPPVADWPWYEGEPGCDLSPIARKVDEVVRATLRKGEEPSRLSSEARLTTRRNAFGPALMDSEAIFKAAGRLIELADVEVDLISFAMDPDAEPYRELVRAFWRRVASGRPFAEPFRIRIYTDHQSPFFLGGLARTKARALLQPWLDVYRAHNLDPATLKIEVYVHAHGVWVYNRGGRYSVHDKMLIVDGSYLHISGANPQKKNNYARPERDTAFVMKGDVAASAMDAFDSLWSRSDFACTIENAAGRYRTRCADRQTPFVVEHSASIATPRFEAIGLSEHACLPMTVLSKGKRGLGNYDGYENPWAKGVLAAVSAAERHVALSSPNMNTRPLQAALTEAALTRDVAVRLLLPHGRNAYQVNFLGGFGSNVHSLKVLRACGLRARSSSEEDFQRFRRNMQAAWWVAEGARRPFTGDGPGCFHSKFASFDDQVVMVGSGNLDDQSFYHSTETSVVIDSAVVTRAVARSVFEPEWDRSERIDLWKDRLEEWFPRRPVGGLIAPHLFGLCVDLSYSLD
jgi:phosphatidylserine/phosphatidylglycerophosphate/cardiolipin synthase-like enzyme